MPECTLHPARHTPEPAEAERRGLIMSFDFGTRRIGVAIGESQLGLARALTTLDTEVNAARFAAIARLIADWQPVHLLVGQPRNDDGTPHAMTARCERFANQLRGRFALPVELVDERFSSHEAESALRQRRLSWRERKRHIDAEAARVILQDWFDTRASHTPMLPAIHAAA